MSSPAIRIHGLGKRYRLGDVLGYGTLRDALSEGWGRFRGAGRPAPASIWALRDIEFDVAEGEAVGIVGRNGAGKSTLLKILSRITEPTTGRVEIYGRVSSLLEVGTGFHAELSGRENIFLNGAILGMSRSEILRRFDEIVEFAEIAAFIDTPVKRYSSGMYLRLAFAVAAHLEPEILIVDEILAVGDAQFQRKCLGRMRSVAGEGRTVLFVSHNLAAVRGLCTSGVLLDGGRLVQRGSIDAVLAAYADLDTSAGGLSWDRQADESSSRPPVRFVRVELDSSAPRVEASDPVRVLATVQVDDRPSHVIPALHFMGADESILFSTACWELDEMPPGRYTFAVTVPPYLLPEGRITISAYAYNTWRPGTIELPCDWIRRTISFDVDAGDWVEATRSRWLRTWPGAVRPRIPWQLLPSAEDCPSITPT